MHSLIKLVVGNFSIMSFGDIYILIPLYMEARGLNDPKTIGWVISAYYAVSMISRPFAYRVVERFSFKLIFSVTSCACIVSGAGIALSGSEVLPIIFFRAVAGLSSSLFIVCLTVYQTLIVPEQARGSSFVLVTVGSIAPLISIVPIAEWLLRVGKTDLYVWLPIIPAFLCLFIAITFNLSDETIKMRSDWGSYKEVFACPALRVLFLSVILFSLTDAVIVSFAGLALEKKLLASSFISSQALTAILTRLFGFRLMDIIPRSRFAALSFTMTGGSIIAITFAKSNAAFMIWGAIYGFAMGYGFPLHLALIGDIVSERLRPKVTSLVWFFMSVSYFILPIIIGLLAGKFSFGIAYRIIMSCVVIAAPFVHMQFIKHF